MGLRAGYEIFQVVGALVGVWPCLVVVGALLVRCARSGCLPGGGEDEIEVSPVCLEGEITECEGSG